MTTDSSSADRQRRNNCVGGGHERPPHANEISGTLL